MKCTNCYTQLPEFGRFQKRVCPNCGKSVSGISEPKKTELRPRPVDIPGYAVMQAIAARDALLLVMLCNLCALLLSIVTIFLLGPGGIVFLFAYIGTLLSFPFFLIRAVSKRRYLHPSERPELKPMIWILILGFVSFMGVCALCVGIRDSTEYNRSKDRFVQVEATITRIDVTQDNDGDEDHDVYISYTFYGKLYEDVEYPKYKSSMDLGDPLTVAIDPENPDKLPKDGTSEMIVGSIFTVIGLTVLYFASVRPILVRRKYRYAD